MNDYNRLYQTHFVGRDGFIWWIGQIASDSWRKNIPGSTPQYVSLENQPGFGYRYQVRIMGYHTADDSANGLRDDDLPWASVMYPVTAGGAGGVDFERPKLRKGNFVYGFFLDGEDGQQPVIIGVLGYNQYQKIYKEEQSKPFVPFMGYGNEDIIPTYAITAEKDPPPIGILGGVAADSDNKVIGTTQQLQQTAAREQEKDDGNQKIPLKLPTICEKSKSPGQIQKDIQKMIQDIQKATKGLKNLKYSITHPIQFEGRQISIQEYIQIKVERAAKDVSKWIKDRITEAQQWIERKINRGFQDFYFILFPDKQSDLKDKVETAMDLVKCLFKKIIKNLLNMVRKALFSVVNRFINVPLCAAENILAALIGKLSGLINSSVAAIMAPVEAVLGAIDIVGDVLGFIESILTFLSCEEEPECPEIESWSLWDGPSTPIPTFDPTSLINKVRNFASGVSQSIDPDNFNFNLDFGDIFVDTCNVGPVLCGAPNVVFWGGSGSSVVGNTIVNAVGEILGVDIVSTGFGYATRAPFVRFEDSCGNGNGAYGRAVLGSVSRQDDGTYQPDSNGNETGVVGVILEEPGYGYLPSQNGSQGGDGRVWADANQTTVQRNDGTWDTPYDPGEVITLLPGDTIRIPPGSVIPADDSRDVTIVGGVYTTILFSRTVTAPEFVEPITPSAESRYSVLLYMCDAIIKNPGFGYRPGDKVVLTPNYGIEIDPQFNELGQLVSLKILSSGTGITTPPSISIESTTGFNAQIIPRFCIDRVQPDVLREPTIQDKIISVVDCVGKL